MENGFVFHLPLTEAGVSCINKKKISFLLETSKQKLFTTQKLFDKNQSKFLVVIVLRFTPAGPLHPVNKLTEKL
jgi:hypothetical protein